MTKFILIVIALVLIASQAFKTRNQNINTHVDLMPSVLDSQSAVELIDSVSLNDLESTLTDSGYLLTNEDFQQFMPARVQKPIVEEVETAYNKAVAEATAAAGHR